MAENEETKVNFVKKIKDLNKEKNIMAEQIKELTLKLEHSNKENELTFENLARVLVPFGTILPFAGTQNVIPKGFLLCDGQQVERNQYQELFKIIATNFGAAGNHNTTFNIPDLRGYFLRGTDYGAGRDADRNERSAVNNGKKGDEVGSYQGDIFANHNHTISNNRIFQDFYLSAWGGCSHVCQNTGTISVLEPLKIKAPVLISEVLSLASYTDPNGGNETRPKNIYVNYIIKY